MTSKPRIIAVNLYFYRNFISIVKKQIMKKPKFLEPDENLIGKWTIVYKPENKGLYNGNLYVTDKRLIYDAKFDLSATGLIKETLMLQWGSQKFLAIPKSEIENTEIKSSFFKKQLIVHLKDGSKHIFDYGMLSVKKLAEAVK